MDYQYRRLVLLHAEIIPYLSGDSADFGDSPSETPIFQRSAPLAAGPAARATYAHNFSARHKPKILGQNPITKSSVQDIAG